MGGCPSLSRPILSRPWLRFPSSGKGLRSATVVALGSNSALGGPASSGLHSSPGCGTWAIDVTPQHPRTLHNNNASGSAPRLNGAASAQPAHEQVEDPGGAGSNQRNLRVERLDGGRFGSPDTLSGSAESACLEVRLYDARQLRRAWCSHGKQREIPSESPGGLGGVGPWWCGVWRVGHAVGHRRLAPLDSNARGPRSGRDVRGLRNRPLGPCPRWAVVDRSRWIGEWWAAPPDNNAGGACARYARSGEHGTRCAPRRTLGTLIWKGLSRYVARSVGSPGRLRR